MRSKVYKILVRTRCVGTFLVRERQGAFLSPLRHMEQLLSVTSCDSPAGIEASLQTHTGGHTDGHTDVSLEIVFYRYWA